MLSKFATGALALVMMFVSISTPSAAEAKSPIKLTAKAATSVPLGSQDFQIVQSPQGPTFVQWIVKAPGPDSTFTWQIWKGDFNAYQGVFINQAKIYELPSGTSFLAKPVITRFQGTTGVVYSTVWDTGTEIRSEVEVVTLEAENGSSRQVVDAFPTYIVSKSSDEYQMYCQSSTLGCGYTKVALGGEPNMQTTIAALETNGTIGQARIGVSSSIHFRAADWTDVEWIDTTPFHNFSSEKAFTYGESGGVFFVYISRDVTNHAEFVKISLSTSPSVVQTITEPVQLDHFGGVQDVMLTRLSSTYSVISYVVSDYRNLQIWSSNLSTQFDVPGTPTVAYSALSRDLGPESYKAQRLSDTTAEFLVPSTDSRSRDRWQIDRVVSNIFEPDSDVNTLVKGNDFDTRVTLGESFTAYNNSYALSLDTLKASNQIGGTSVYQSDYGVVSVPIKTRGAQLVDHTVFGEVFTSLVWNVNNLKKGNAQFVEFTKVHIKVAPKLVLFATTNSNNVVDGYASNSLTDWTSMSDIQVTTAQWYRCTKRITAVLKVVPKTCKKIVGQTGGGYTPTSADLGKYLTVALKAKNLYGTATAVLPSSKAIR